MGHPEKMACTPLYAFRASRRGCAHHVRNRETGAASPDPNLSGQVVERIRDVSDVNRSLTS